MPYAQDPLGNVRIDFVWGNMPMQPDDGRGTPLDKALGNHNVVDTQWAGYPQHQPGLSGTWDDITTPNVVGMLEAAATAALIAAGLTKGAVTTTNVGANGGNDLTVKTQTPAAGVIQNPSAGRALTPVALEKYLV